MAWLRRLVMCDIKWKNIVHQLDPDTVEVSHFGSKKIIKSNKLHCFWFDVFKAYDQLSQNVKLNDSKEINAEPIFYNQYNESP